jgi:hypothetical protein
MEDSWPFSFEERLVSSFWQAMLRSKNAGMNKNSFFISIEFKSYSQPM